MTKRLALAIALLAAVKTDAQREFAIWLEIPELGTRIEAGGHADVPHANATQLRVIIGGQPDQVRYGSIVSRINTESSNIVMATRSVEQGVACEFNLLRHDGFRLRPGRNSVEITFFDSRQRLYYASFLIQAGARAATTRGAVAAPLEPPSGRRRAVIMGVSRYRHPDQGLRNLAFADRDAAAFRDFLIDPAGAGLDAEDVSFLINEDATLERVRAAFQSLTRAAADDMIFIYVAAHAVADPADRRSIFLLTHDSRPDAMQSSAIPMTEIEDLYARAIKARSVATFVDTARMAGLVTGSSGAQHNLSHQYWMRYAGVGGRFVLAAADVGETSAEVEALRSGAFTHALVRGLRGEAESQRDGTITASELRSFVNTEVQRLTGGRQTPVWSSAADGLALAGRALGGAGK